VPSVKCVKLRTILAGPGIGPYDEGSVVDFDDKFADALIRAGVAVEVPSSRPPARGISPETAVEETRVETTDQIRRGPGRPRKS
jgi:hypothetical protein